MTIDLQADVLTGTSDAAGYSAPAPVLLGTAISFDPADPARALSMLPDGCGVFALFAEDAHAEPYLAKAAHLRRRLHRLLRPTLGQTRRLQLAEKIRRIEYTETGSDFASELAFYDAAAAVEKQSGGAGRSAAKRLRLHPAAFLKVGMENRFPRAVISTRLTRNKSAQPVGPFPSKLAAERYLEEVLNLFLLRRCVENLVPDPAHPGCVYSGMKKCLAPCYAGCTEDRYQDEAKSVEQFLLTRGRSLLQQIDAERLKASEQLEFEEAALLHQRYLKVEAVAAQMPEVARALSQLSGVIVQPGNSLDHVALFSIDRGLLTGPVAYSTVGMRLHNELSGSSSLYTQPMALQPIPLAEGDANAVVVTEVSRDMLETRLDEALVLLRAREQDVRKVQDHLSLFARWYYRPQTKRIGEILFADDDGQVAKRPLLRAISRVAAAVQFGAGAPGQKASQWHA